MRSFRNRLLLLVVGLIVVTQTVTLVAVLATSARAVRARAGDRLEGGARYARQLLDFRGSQLASGVRVLAADFGLREAVATHDAPTILSAASNHAERIHADLVVVADAAGHTIAASRATGASFVRDLGSLGEVDAEHESRFTLVDGRLYQVFVAPVRAPQPIAWVALGFPVDDALAARIATFVDADVSVVERDAHVLRVVASTLPADARARLGTGQRMALDGTPVEERHAGHATLARAVPLVTGDTSIELVLQAPLERLMAPYVELRNQMLGLGGAALVLAVVLAIRLGRNTSRPLDELAEAARQIEAGQYDREIAVRGSDEILRLGATLNAMQRGIAEREARLLFQADHDALTGLVSRAGAERKLAALVADAPRPRLAMMIDLDDLRSLNASFGHEVGDEVLKSVASRLERVTRAAELVARHGSSRFLLVLDIENDESAATAVAESILAALPRRLDVHGLPVELNASAGLARWPQHGPEAAELIRRAEIALEDATATGARLGWYRDGRDEEHRRRVALLADLRVALETDALELAYQPKLSLTTRRASSAEALVRWKHPTLGPVSPAEFVPLAEQSGLAPLLGRWVLNAALRQLRTWRDRGSELEVAINVSADDLLDPGFADQVVKALEIHRVPATALVLEITESAVMRDPAAAARAMQALKVVGIRFAIDDFGTGFSSLSQLSRLPVDELKIDRAFVSRALSREDDAAIVQLTVDLGHRLGLRVVAEGVEDAATLEFLAGVGCDLVQGFHVARPLPPLEFAAFIAAQPPAAGTPSNVLPLRKPRSAEPA
jgi:diguanylate cyclase (GGDEF)-like protein